MALPWHVGPSPPARPALPWQRRGLGSWMVLSQPRRFPGLGRECRVLHRVVVAPCHPRWVLDYLLVSSFWTGSAKALCSQSSLNPDPSQTPAGLERGRSWWKKPFSLLSWPRGSVRRVVGLLPGKGEGKCPQQPGPSLSLDPSLTLCPSLTVHPMLACPCHPAVTGGCGQSPHCPPSAHRVRLGPPRAVGVG